MNTAIASTSTPTHHPRNAAAGAEAEWPTCARYCPANLLAAFTLLMAGHGRAVNVSMMIGDREYAMAQLARAHTLGDAELRELSAKLFSFFDDVGAPVPVGLRA